MSEKPLFQGRLCRKNYIVGWLVVNIFILLFAFLLWAIVKLVQVIFVLDIMFVFNLIVGPILLLLNFSLLVRRHHDLNQPWYYPLLVISAITLLGLFISDSLVSLVGGIYALLLLTIKGKDDNNNFGPSDDRKKIFYIIGLAKQPTPR